MIFSDIKCNPSLKFLQTSTTMGDDMTLCQCIPSLKYQTASFCNTLQNPVNVDLRHESSHKTKGALTNHFLNDYQHWQKKSIKGQSNDCLLKF